MTLMKHGFPERMRIYLDEMYPVPRNFVFWALLCTSFMTLLARIQDTIVTFLSFHLICGVLSIFLFGLILRLMDELKDREIDKELFYERPLPSGRVLESDIIMSLLIIIGSYILINAWMGKAFIMALVLLCYSLLMFRYFFIPGILRKYLFLNLLTHNPVIFLLHLYIVFVFAAERQMNLRQIDWHTTILIIVMFWSMFFAWEIARKIRSKEEENAYVTYSQLLGQTGAVFLAGGAQTVTFVIGLYINWKLSMSLAFPVLMTIVYGRTLWGYIRFLLNPNPVTSKLKHFAEQYLLSVFIAILIAHMMKG